MESLTGSAMHDPPSPSSPPLHQRQNRQSQTFSNLTSSAFSYFVEPVAYTFAGISRRISNDDAPTPLARALSANYNGSMETAVFNPPVRRFSPFQPPPLTPLTLAGYKDSTPLNARLLSKAVAEEIRLLVPPPPGCNSPTTGSWPTRSNKTAARSPPSTTSPPNTAASAPALCSSSATPAAASSAPTSPTRPAQAPATTAQESVSSGAHSDSQPSPTCPPCHRPRAPTQPTSAA